MVYSLFLANKYNMFLKSLTAIYTAKKSNFLHFFKQIRMVLFLDAVGFHRRGGKAEALARGV